MRIAIIFAVIFVAIIAIARALRSKGGPGSGA